MRPVIGEDYPGHRHDFFEFFLLTEGRLEHAIDGEERVLEKGDIVMLSPAHVHSFRCLGDGPVRSYQVLFMPSLLGAGSEYLRRDKSFAELIFMVPFYEDGCMVFRLSGKPLLKVQTLFREMLEECSGKQKGYRAAVKAKLTDLLITVARTYDKEKDVNPHITKRMSGTADAILGSVSYIEEHFAEDLKLEEVADHCAGVTKEYFSTVFHNITGTTFSQYIAGLRIARAKELLTASDQKVISVCFDSGFNDLSHFNRTFKKLTGVTPSEYRNSRCRNMKKE
mgnify:CR=1 FL=1